MTETPESREESLNESGESAEVHSEIGRSPNLASTSAADREPAAGVDVAADVLRDLNSPSTSPAPVSHPLLALGERTKASLAKTRDRATLLAIFVSVVALALLTTLPITWTLLAESSAPTALRAFAVALQTLAGILIVQYAAGLLALARAAIRLQAKPTTERLEQFAMSQLSFRRFAKMQLPSADVGRKKPEPGDIPLSIDRAIIRQVANTRNYAIALTVFSVLLGVILIGATPAVSIYLYIAFGSENSLSSAILNLFFGAISALFAVRFVRLSVVASRLIQAPSSERLGQFISSHLSLWRLTFAILFGGFGFLIVLACTVGFILFVKLYLG